MNKKLLIGSITAALVLGGSFAVGASEIPIFDLKTNKLKYEKEFIPAEQANTIALNEVNGTVEDVEIEKENGHYYYEVEVDKDNIDYDIFVEAYTGKIAYIRVENDDKIKNSNEVEKDDHHDDGTKEVTTGNKPQSSSTSKPAITKTVQNQQVHDDGNGDQDDDRQEKIKSTLSPVPAASKPVTTKPVQKTQVRDHVRDNDDDDWDDDRDDDDDDVDDNDDDWDDGDDD